MATLSWWTRQARGVRPVPSSGLVGRSKRCDVALDDLDVPHFWREIRWRGDRWAWRTLSDDGRTRGAGTRLDDGWREFGGRVTCGEHVGVEIVDPSAPEPFVVDLIDGTTLRGDALDRVLEVRSDVVLPADWESNAARPLEDGDVVVLDGRPWRVALPGPVMPTAGTELDLAQPDVYLDVDLPNLTAVFSRGRTQAAVHAEAVRILAVFAMARRDDSSDGGWLTTAEAFEGWIGLGGNAASPRERIGWLKGKLRTELSTRRVGNIGVLFENRRDGVPVSRLGLDPTRITVTT